MPAKFCAQSIADCARKPQDLISIFDSTTTSNTAHENFIRAFLWIELFNVAPVSKHLPSSYQPGADRSQKVSLAAIGLALSASAMGPIPDAQP